MSDDGIDDAASPGTAAEADAVLMAEAQAEAAAHDAVHTVQLSESRIKRTLWFALGLAFVTIGTIGIFVPGLPTTGFMILAAACFFRSSQRMYDWIIRNRIVGVHVRNFREHRLMPARAKFFALSMMWVFVLFAVLWGIPVHLVWAKGVTLVTAGYGTFYILKLPTQILAARIA